MASRTRSRRQLVTVTLPDGRVFTADGLRHGLPVFWWGSAPAGLVTKRQLDDQRLRPGGHPPVALLEWRWGKRWGRLFDINRAVEKNPMTSGRCRGVQAALAARMRCQLCPSTKDFVHAGLCSRCYEVAGPTRPGDCGLVNISF